MKKPNFAKRVCITALALALLLVFIPPGVVFAEESTTAAVTQTEQKPEKKSIWKQFTQEGVVGTVFDYIVSDFLCGILNDFFGWIDKMLTENLMPKLLRVEDFADERDGLDFSILKSATLKTLYEYIYTQAVLLATLKLLWKGFQIYILHRDGDADNPPSEQIVGMIMCIAAMVSFPTLYKIMANTTQEIADSILKNLGGAEKINMLQGWGDISVIPKPGGLIIIFCLVYAVMVLVLLINLLTRGAELLIMRLGVPFACLGLIDSDGGIFKGYMQQFFKLMATSVIQVTLFSLSLKSVATWSYKSILLSVVFLSVAMKTPQLLNNFIIPSSGRGIGSAVQTVSQGVNLAKNIATKSVGK